MTKIKLDPDHPFFTGEDFEAFPYYSWTTEPVPIEKNFKTILNLKVSDTKVGGFGYKFWCDNTLSLYLIEDSVEPQDIEEHSETVLVYRKKLNAFDKKLHADFSALGKVMGVRNSSLTIDDITSTYTDKAFDILSGAEHILPGVDDAVDALVKRRYDYHRERALSRIKKQGPVYLVFD